MSLLIAGIDEAGYGPMLGPLCVGMAVLRVRDWTPGEPAPCLWRRLKAGVCRKPGDSRRRVAVADSKLLKLPNDGKTRHPLMFLERGVLAFLRCAEPDGLPAAPGPRSGPQIEPQVEPQIACDESLLRRLGAALGPQPWYAGPPVPVPIGIAAGQVAVAANRVATALEASGVELVELRCRIVCEAGVNHAIRRSGTKADATAAAVGEHLRRILSRPRRPGEHVRIVCDQLGGRTQYLDMLSRELHGHDVTALECGAGSGERSRSSYAVAAGDAHAGEPPRVYFQPEAEAAHLPVALASMTAKLIRELAMIRFNRYWCARMPELKPTAGYYGDAARWLRDAAGCLSPHDRADLVRLA